MKKLNELIKEDLLKQGKLIIQGVKSFEQFKNKKMLNTNYSASEYALDQLQCTSTSQLKSQSKYFLSMLIQMVEAWRQYAISNVFSSKYNSKFENNTISIKTNVFSLTVSGFDKNLKFSLNVNNSNLDKNILDQLKSLLTQLSNSSKKINIIHKFAESKIKWYTDQCDQHIKQYSIPDSKFGSYEYGYPYSFFIDDAYKRFIIDVNKLRVDE